MKVVHQLYCIVKDSPFKSFDLRRFMPIRRQRAKVVVGLFWAESWLFGQQFLRYRLQICLARYLHYD